MTSPAARALLLAGLLLLGGCAAREAYEAAAGRSVLVGFCEREMRMCAGLPQRTWSDDGGAIWSYELDSKQTGGLTVSSPIIHPPFGGGVSVCGNCGTCRMQVHFAGGEVAEVAFAGDADNGPARNAVCAPLVCGCPRYARPGGPPAGAAAAANTAASKAAVPASAVPEAAAGR